jgi:hypothetical protein
MTPRTLGLLVSLALGILAVSLAVDAQQPPTVYRIRLFHVGLDHIPPGLDTLREQTGPRRPLRPCGVKPTFLHRISSIDTTAQPSSRHPLPPWGVNSTLPRRYQLDQHSGPHGAS